MSSRAAHTPPARNGDLDDVDDVRHARRQAQVLAADLRRPLAVPALVDLVEALLHLGREPEPPRERRRDLARRRARVAALHPPDGQKPLLRARRRELRRRPRRRASAAPRAHSSALPPPSSCTSPRKARSSPPISTRGLVRVAGAAHRAQQRDVVDRRQLGARRAELLAQPSGDDRITQRLLQRLVVADVRRQRDRRQHLREADRGRRS